MSALDKPRVTGPEVLLQLTGTNSPPRSCTLLGIERGKFHVRLDDWIEPASRVSAAFARITLTGEVVYCTRKDGWYRTCVAIISNDDQSRRQPRLPVQLPGRVVIMADHGTESDQGLLLDVSVSGMRVDVPHRVEPGTMIFVETGSILVVGEVRHCDEGRNGRFEAGVEITDTLYDVKSGQDSPGVFRNMRRKLAERILGEPIFRKLL